MRTGRSAGGSVISTVAATCLAALISVAPRPAFGQATPPASRAHPLEVKGALGFSTFIDENFIEHLVAAGSVRLGVSRRWSIEPEFLYMRGGAYDQDFFLLGNVIYDMKTRGVITPYWIVGGGIFWHRTKFGLPREQVFVATSWQVSGGAGARIGLGQGWSLTADARFGLEPFFQVTSGLAYAF